MGDDSLSSKLAIYISCSATNDKPTFPFLYNIYAGAALNNNTIDSDTLKDNIGDNISEKNPYYCELTVHYYAWKNTNADYLGFFHSRRYISFNRQNLVDKSYSKRKLPKPYIVKDFPTKELLEKNGYDKENIISLLKIYPIIGVIPEKMPETTYEHLIRTQKNGKTEFKLIEEKLKLNYPEFCPRLMNICRADTYIFVICMLCIEIFLINIAVGFLIFLNMLTQICHSVLNEMMA